MANLLSKRFKELIEQATVLESKKMREHDPFTNMSTDQVDRNELLNWKTKAKHLIVAACGEDSEHFKAFKDSESRTYSTSFDNLKRMKAVFLAAQEDYDGGYLNSVRLIVQAELFDSEIEQASELLSAGYKSASAVIAGTILETSLRELCTKAGLQHGKADRMNADLAKAGTYNSVTAKRVTAMLGIRNSAAHGKPDEFTDGDVKSMIEDLGRFLSQHMM